MTADLRDELVNMRAWLHEALIRNEVDKQKLSAFLETINEFFKNPPRAEDISTTSITVAELQADEIRTIILSQEQPIWIFAAIEVWSRLWPSTVVGRRSYRNTLALFRDISSRMNLKLVSLISTDGFDFYRKVVQRIFGPACLYGQDIKTRRNNRVIKVERRAVIGAPWR